MVSSLGMIVSGLLLTFTLQQSSSSTTNSEEYSSIIAHLSVSAVILYVWFFEMGLGPIPWFVVPELVEQKVLATIMSISCLVNWICNISVGMLFPICELKLGAYSFSPFLAFLAFTIGYTWFLLPETRGRSPQDIKQIVTTPKLSKFPTTFFHKNGSNNIQHQQPMSSFNYSSIKESI